MPRPLWVVISRSKTAATESVIMVAVAASGPSMVSATGLTTIGNLKTQFSVRTAIFCQLPSGRMIEQK